MASLTPGGALVSFGGVTVASIGSVAGIGFGSIKSQTVKAFEPVLGLTDPIDLFNTAAAPRTRQFTPTVYIIADNSLDAAGAWAALMTAYRTLDDLPETGTLVVKNDAASSGTVSCQARRDPLDLNITPSNARYLAVPMLFTLLSPWV